MIVQCPTCQKYYDDEYRYTFCPHESFAANDGRNNFTVHTDSYLHTEAPDVTGIHRFRSKRIDNE